MSEVNNLRTEALGKLPENCIGSITFNGVVYHGQAIPVEEAHRAGKAQLDLEVDYTQQFLTTSLSKPHIWDRIGNVSLTLGPGYYTTMIKAEAEKYAQYRVGNSSNIP